MDIIEWLLESDPAIRWQTLRDFVDASAATVAAESARVAREGLGAEILAAQKADGSWRRAETPVGLPSLFTLLLLRATGANRTDAGIESAVARIEANLRWDQRSGFWELRQADIGASSFFEGEVEPWINGGVLALGAYFGRPTESLAYRLVSEQLEDGGWNCDAH